MKFTVRKAEYIIGLHGGGGAGSISTPSAALQRGGHRDADGGARLGRWTAEWFLARGLGRGDVCPAGDLAVRRAFEHFYNRGRALSERAIRRRASRWGEHQNLAIHYLLAGQRLAAPSRGGGT